ncbi:unnamed protein product [Pelagomonas calceolata]|uniref:Uncharacterized protein n=1 Tax=Pelagomonas calceolata TaxID=35677 RepID=A0A8J2SJZ1_9STRA|nr:unnamed protein product [Pelagomonas calceolata]
MPIMRVGLSKVPRRVGIYHKTDYSSLARRPRRHLQAPQLGAVVARLHLRPARLRHDRGLFVELADQCGVVLRGLPRYGGPRRRQPARLRVGELEAPRVARALAAAAGRLAAVVARVEAPGVPALRELREELPRLVGRDVVQVEVLGVAQPGAELRCPRVVVVLGVELFTRDIRRDDRSVVVVVAAAFLLLLGFFLLLVLFVFVLFLVLLFLALAVLTAAGAV